MKLFQRLTIVWHSHRRSLAYTLHEFESKFMLSTFTWKEFSRTKNFVLNLYVHPSFRLLKTAVLAF